MPRYVIRLSFTDNNGKRARVQTYAGAEEFEGAAAYAAALSSALQAISSAALVEYDVSTKVPIAGAPAAEPDSDVASSMLLFYRSGDNVQSTRVPSPGKLPTEATGPYTGIRLTRELAQVSGVLGALEDISALLADGLGGPYPTAFSVGGRIEL